MAVDNRAELARRLAAARDGGGAERSERQHREGKLTARERVELLLDAGSFVEIDALVTHRCRDFGMEKQTYPGRRRRLRLRHDRRPPGLRLRPGLHRLRRLALGDQRPQDLQGDGPGGRERRAGHRPQRLGRGPHPGGGRLARRLRRHLPAQHARLRRRAADLRDPRPLRGRRGLLAGHHRLHPDGRDDQLHVRHRPRRDPDGHPRGGHQGGSRRRHDPRRARAASATSPTATTPPA